MAARVVSVADAFRELTEDRPGRSPLQPAQALRQLETESGSRFDRDCLSALAQEIGESSGLVRPRRDWPASLTDREVEVLRLIARGFTVKEAARALVVSESTARHHLEHIYAKAGVNSRAGAVIFAAENNLLA
jgi:DNA-binding NarL/FixJ family response regulator